MQGQSTPCACGCGEAVKSRTDGRQQRFRKGHSGIGQLVSGACAQCSNQIRVERWRVDRFRFVTCSRVCAGAHRARLAIKTLACEQCHATFDMKASKKQGKRTFCSLACFYAAYRAAPDSKIDVTCSGCSKTIRVHPSKFKLNQHFYCGRVCRALHIMGANNPSYTSGVGRRREYAANWRRQRGAVIARDGGRCRKCGKAPIRARDIHVHHLIAAWTFDGDWTRANVEANLVTLCSPCHMKIEHGKAALQLSFA